MWLISGVRLLLVVLVAVVSLSAQDQWPQWRLNQRTHQMTQLSDADQLTFCGKTNMAEIHKYVDPMLVTRIVGSANHKRIGMFLKDTMEGLGFTTEWDRFTGQTPLGQRTFRNLIATYDSTAPRRLTLVCHYDSKIMAGYEFIGATDSALPCALMLDVARTLAPLLYKRTNKEVTLQLLFLDGEEAFVEWTNTDSIYGARHLAETWERKWYPTTGSGSNFILSKELDRLDVFVLLDLLGAKNPTITNANGLGAENLYSELPKIESDLRRLKCLKAINPIFQNRLTNQGVADDHIPFLQRGVRVMHLISVPFPSVWHTRGDDQTALDDDTIANLASVLRVFVASYLGVPAH